MHKLNILQELEERLVWGVLEIDIGGMSEQEREDYIINFEEALQAKQIAVLDPMRIKKSDGKKVILYRDLAGRKSRYYRGLKYA